MSFYGPVSLLEEKKEKLHPEKIRATLEKLRIPSKTIDKMIEKYKMYYVFADYIDPKASHVSLSFYLGGLEKALKEIISDLKKLPTVEERRKYLLENIGISRPRKVGEFIVWALPAFATCPGLTNLCFNWCYAAKGRYPLPDAHRIRAINLLSSLLPEFPTVLKKKIERISKRTGVKTVRLHDSGNFYTISWIKDWLRRLDINLKELENLLGINFSELPDDKYIKDIGYVVRSLPDIRFYTYTRIWSEDQIFKSIEKHILPNKNFVLYLSVDKTMPRNEIVDAFKYAGKYENVKLSFSGFLPEDLIKRYGRKVVFCPNSIAKIKRHKPPTCDKCGICVKGLADVVFPLH